MTLTIDVNTNDVIDLPECVRLLSGIKGTSRRERVDDAARYLRMLSNNKSFLIELVNRQIREAQPLDAYQLSSNFSQQIVDLGGGPGFRLRANMWPRCVADAPADWERSLFAYLMPHDHNADFFSPLVTGALDTRQTSTSTIRRGPSGSRVSRWTYGSWRGRGSPTGR
ncbi:hypothetical protein [Sorangium sp. So ce542]|uniref:hypothetical protein n=1 Tax=Sorangium sp. So ce542 TaxID=3133316 RepID=UPI003F6131AE